MSYGGTKARRVSPKAAFAGTDPQAGVGVGAAGWGTPIIESRV